VGDIHMGLPKWGLLFAGSVFSSCVRDPTKFAIKDRNSSIDGMSISSAT
jgi:hypothetical protein